jgi:cytidine deaminase
MLSCITYGLELNPMQPSMIAKRSSPPLASGMMNADKLEKMLIETAIQAATHAYAPISGFHVGAAILSKDGNIYMGANLENAAFKAVHAETSALAAARAAEGEKFQLEAIAIVAQNADGVQQPCSPCGSCRQFLLEFSKTARVVHFGLIGDELKLFRDTPATLLPHGFTLER